MPFNARAQASPGAPGVSHGYFSDVQIARPAGTPQQFVLLLSTSDTPSAADRQLAQSMVNAGAMVATVPLNAFYRRLEAEGGKCAYAAGAFENLARYVQAAEKLPTYLLPMLVGSDGAAAFAYALLAQAPSGTFASALSLNFCPRMALKIPLCATEALRWRGAAQGSGIELLPAARLNAPWTAVQQRNGDAACSPAGAAQSFVARVPQATWVPHAAASAASASAAGPSAAVPSVAVPAGFEAAYAGLATQRVALDPPPAQLADLPIVEVPSSGAGARFAVLLSGDGGWASIDKEIAASLAKRGVPVAGFDSLRYFWSERTPGGLATDLDRIIRYYAARWKRTEVILIGYSQGADVLPFALNRLPPRTRASVRLTALLGLGQNASFEFHVTNWIGPSGDRPIAPEAMKLSAATTLCVYGTEETDSLCPQLAPRHVRALALPGDHHFSGEYDALAARILEAVPR